MQVARRAMILQLLKTPMSSIVAQQFDLAGPDYSKESDCNICTAIAPEVNE